MTDEKDNALELKACPHGQEARIINIGGLAPFSIYLGPDHACHRDFGWFATRAEAIAAWNTRPSQPIADDLREALERIAQPVFVAEPEGTPDSVWRVVLNERIEIARTALQAKGGEADHCGIVQVNEADFTREGGEG